MSYAHMSSVQRQMFELLEGWLRHKSDMVNLEAARAICEMKHVTPAQLTKAIGGMSTLTFSSFGTEPPLQFCRSSSRLQNRL